MPEESIDNNIIPEVEVKAQCIIQCILFYNNVTNEISALIIAELYVLYHSCVRLFCILITSCSKFKELIIN